MSGHRFIHPPLLPGIKAIFGEAGQTSTAQGVISELQPLSYSQQRSLGGYPDLRAPQHQHELPSYTEGFESAGQTSTAPEVMSKLQCLPGRHGDSRALRHQHELPRFRVQFGGILKSRKKQTKIAPLDPSQSRPKRNKNKNSRIDPMTDKPTDESNGIPRSTYYQRRQSRVNPLNGEPSTADNAITQACYKQRRPVDPVTGEPSTADNAIKKGCYDARNYRARKKQADEQGFRSPFYQNTAEVKKTVLDAFNQINPKI